MGEKGEWLSVDGGGVRGELTGDALAGLAGEVRKESEARRRSASVHVHTDSNLLRRHGVAAAVAMRCCTTRREQGGGSKW